MHTFRPSAATSWAHDEDNSGEVKLLVNSSRVQQYGSLAQVNLPFEDILALVHRYQERKSEEALEAVRELEKARNEGLIGNPPVSGWVRQRIVQEDDIPEEDRILECSPTITTDPNWSCSTISGQDQNPETD